MDSHSVVRLTDRDIRVDAEIGPRKQDLIESFFTLKRVDTKPDSGSFCAQPCAGFPVDPQIAGKAIDRSLVSAGSLQENAQAADSVFDHRTHRPRKVGRHPLVFVAHDRRVHCVVDDRGDRVAIGIVNPDYVYIMVYEAIPVSTGKQLAVFACGTAVDVDVAAAAAKAGSGRLQDIFRFDNSACTCIGYPVPPFVGEVDSFLDPLSKSYRCRVCVGVGETDVFERDSRFFGNKPAYQEVLVAGEYSDVYIDDRQLGIAIRDCKRSHQ